jgi:DNA-binding beta-propeller fold protein YncE
VTWTTLDVADGGAGPYGIAPDAAGNMLISDGIAQLWLIAAQTKQQRLVLGTDIYGSNLDPSSPSKTQLSYPKGVAFGPGGWSAYIADEGNVRVVKVLLDCVGQ